MHLMILALFLVFLTVLLLLPIGLIFALNTLFALGIAVTVETYAAALILILIFGPRSGISYSKKVQ